MSSPVSNAATVSRAAHAARLLRNAALGAVLLVSCLRDAPHPGTSRPLSARSPRREPPLAAVLVAVDGVRWQEIVRGVDPALARAHGLAAESVVSAAELAPNLHALLADGGTLVGGEGPDEAILASGPEFLSMPGYTEMLTGRRATACRDNGCREAGSPTLADELAAESAPGAVAVLTSWPDIGRIATRALDRVAMSTGRHGGPTRSLFAVDARAQTLLERSANAVPEPGVGDFRPDRYTAELAVRYLEARKPTFMFVALGEPDEYGHRNDYAGYLRALRQADAAVGALARTLSRRAAEGARTLLFVTTDHGRANDFANHGAKHPESARVWLVAWGTALGVSTSAQRGVHHLADLAPTLRVVAKLPPDRDPRAGRPITTVLADSRAPNL